VIKLKIARQSETIEVGAEKLAPLGEKDLMKIHLRDGAGKEVLAQAVDTDYDDYHKSDTLIFQSDFGPNETKTFTMTAGAGQITTAESWKSYVDQFAERLRSPIDITVK
jgi:hypothetical protein